MTLVYFVDVVPFRTMLKKPPPPHGLQLFYNMTESVISRKTANFLLNNQVEPFNLFEESEFHIWKGKLYQQSMLIFSFNFDLFQIAKEFREWVQDIMVLEFSN